MGMGRIIDGGGIKKSGSITPVSASPTRSLSVPTAHAGGSYEAWPMSVPPSASNSTTTIEPSGVAPTLITLRPSLRYAFLGHVQVAAEVQPGFDGLECVEETALAAVTSRGRQVGQADRAGMREQDVDRTGLRDPRGRLGDVGIGDIVALGVRLGPDAADRRQRRAPRTPAPSPGPARPATRPGCAVVRAGRAGRDCRTSYRPARLRGMPPGRLQGPRSGSPQSPQERIKSGRT